MSAGMLLSLLLPMLPMLSVAARAPDRFTLSEPKVLLPMTSPGAEAASHVLTAEGGCFTWTSHRRDVVSVQALLEDEKTPCRPGMRPNYVLAGSNNQGCSRAALVTSTWRSVDQKGSSVVIAREKGSGHEIRCDVFVDRIHRIEIVTTARTVKIDDAPEVGLTHFIFVVFSSFLFFIISVSVCPGYLALQRVALCIPFT